MNLNELLAILLSKGPDGAFAALANARVSADDASLEGLKRILGQEAAALSTWKRTREEPVFGLQQIRNQALACGLAEIQSEAETALATLGEPWLAEVAPPEPEGTGLVRALGGAPGGKASPLTPDGRCTLNRSGANLELRDVETGALVASYPVGKGQALLEAAGKLLVVSSRVQLHELASGTVVFKTARRGSRNTAVSRSGRFVAFGDSEFSGFDGEFSGSSSLELWEIATGQRRWKTGECSRPSRDEPIGFSPDGRHLFFRHEVFSARTGERVCGAGGCVSFTPDGTAVLGIGGISAAEDGDWRHAIHVEPLRGGARREIATDTQLRLIAVSPDGTRVAGADSRESRLYLWELATGKLLWRRERRELGATRILFLSDRGPMVVAGRRIELFDPAQGERLCSIEAHAGEVTALAATPDGRYLVTSDDHEVKVWALQVIGKRARRSPSLTTRQVVLTPDGRRAILVGEAARLARIEARGLVVECKLETGGRAVALSPDGTWLLTVSRDGALVRLRLEDGARSARDGLATESASALWSPDGSRIVVWHNEELRGYRADAGPGIVSEADAWTTHLPRPITDLAFSPDGRLLATAHEDSTQLLDGATGKPLLVVREVADRVAVSNDGYLVIARRDHEAQVWRLGGRTASGRGTASGHVLPSIAPGGRWVLSERSGMVTVEERRTGEAALTKRGEFLGRCATVVFAADGETLGTLTAEEGLTLWHLPRLRRLARVWPPRGVRGFALSQDLSRVVTIDDEGQVHLFRVEGRPPAGVRSRRPRSSRA